MIIRNEYPVLHFGMSTALAALMALVILLSQAVRADPLVLTGPADMATLAPQLEYTIDPTWQLSVQDVMGADLQPLSGPVPNFGYTAAKMWLRADVVNGSTDRDDWRFFVHANFTQAITIWKVGAGGSVETLMDLTTDSPFSARPIPDPQMVAPFRLNPGEAATLVVAYYSQGSSHLSMSVETPESFDGQARLAAAKSYAFYGMMLVMVTLATLALVVLRQAVFAAYAAYLGSVFLYIAHADGVAFQLLWSSFPQFNSVASTVLGSALIISGALFAITFLQTARHHPVMHRVLQGLVVAVLLTVAVLSFVDPQLLKRLLVIMLSINTLTCVIAGLIAARTRFREVRFYVFAWCGVLIPALLFT
ncbi:MAG: 7TMR-DISM family protein, partial [Paracoccaceae bacterium]